MASTADAPELIVPDAVAWRAWLDRHHGDIDGVWLVLARKGTTESTDLDYAHALDEALCYGWIDGQARRRDDTTTLQRFTPRRARSPWSKRNVEHIARLTSERRMHPAGVAEVERAKADGRWDAGAAEMPVPEDLAAALDEVPAARRMFDVLTSRNRFAILRQVTTAKRPETRKRRIEKYVAMLADGQTPYPQKAVPPG